MSVSEHMLPALVQNAMMVLGLSILLSFDYRFIGQHSLRGQVLSGLLFGMIGSLAIIYSVPAADGIVLDLRSVVLALSGLFGTPIVAAIAMGLAGTFRFLLGGEGASIGLLTIVIAGLAGLAAQSLPRQNAQDYTPQQLLGLGAGLHLVIITIIFTLTPLTLNENWQFALTMLTIASIATMLAGLLVQDAQRFVLLAQDLTRSESRLSAITRSLPDHVHVVDDNGQCLDVLTPTTSSDPNSLQLQVGERFHDVTKDYVRDAFLSWLRHAQHAISNDPFECEVATPQGDRVIEIHVNRLPEDIYGVQSSALLSRDITDHRSAQLQIHHLTYIDQLTQLPNRHRALLDLKRALSDTHIKVKTHAFILMDVDSLNLVNDTLGNEVGDRLLIEFANMLRTTLPQDAQLHRFGADEFSIILPIQIDYNDSPEEIAEKTARRILKDVQKLSVHEDQIRAPSASIGFTALRVPDSLESVLSRADLALRHAKHKGGTRAELYRGTLDQNLASRWIVHSGWSRALTVPELRVAYQAQYAGAAQTFDVCGFEALIRWQHPEYGLLYPNYFLPFIEEGSKIEQLTQFLLRSAIGQLREWKDDQQKSNLSISINVDLPPRIRAIQKESLFL